MQLPLNRPCYQNVRFPTVVARFLAVKLGTVFGDVAPIAAASDKVYGFVWQSPRSANGMGEIFREGHAYATASEAIAIGDSLVVTADGRVAKTTTNNAKCIGLALGAATAAGQVIPIEFTKFNY